MRRYEIEIPHSLEPGTVKERLTQAVGKLESSYGATCRWQGDRSLSVQRKGLDATLNIEEKRVRIQMELGFLLVPMAGPIQEKLTRELTSLLA